MKYLLFWPKVRNKRPICTDVPLLSGELEVLGKYEEYW